MDSAPPERRHLLLPVDDTPESMKALNWLFKNLYKDGDVVDLVHVVPDEEVGAPSWLGVYDMPMVLPDNDVEKHVRAFLLRSNAHVSTITVHLEYDVKAALTMVYTKYGAALKDSGALYRVHILRGHTNTGGIAEAIADKADELNGVAIVMAHHPKGMLGTWFLGSVCLDIVNKAKVPLVVIR